MKACSPRVYEHDHYSASQRASKQFYFCPAHWTVLMASSPFYRQAEIANPQIAISVDLFLAVYLCAPPVLEGISCYVCFVYVCIQGNV